MGSRGMKTTVIAPALVAAGLAAWASPAVRGEPLSPNHGSRGIAGSGGGSQLSQLRSSLGAFRGGVSELDRRVRRSRLLRRGVARRVFGLDLAHARAGARTDSGDVMALIPSRIG